MVIKYVRKDGTFAVQDTDKISVEKDFHYSKPVVEDEKYAPVVKRIPFWFIQIGKDKLGEYADKGSANEALKKLWTQNYPQKTSL